MNVSISSTPVHVPTTTPDVQINDPSPTKVGDETLKISFTVGKDGVSGEGYKITLEIPANGGQVSETELEQALKDLGMSGQELQQALALGFQGLELAQNIGEAISKLGVDFVKNNPGSVANLFGRAEVVFEAISRTISDVINNSNYPDFTSFLKTMLATAQELRELASKAKMAALNGQYDVMIQQSENMREIAQLNYDSTMKQLQGELAEACFSLVGGFMSFAGAMGGLSNSAFGNVSGIAGQGAGQMFSAAGQILGSVLKMDGAAIKKEAELLEAGNKALDAHLKKAENSVSIAEELKEIAKALIDMIERIKQDLMSAQMQTIQHANI